MLSQPAPGQAEQDAFHRWYDDEHLPARRGLAGFESADRFRASDNCRPEWLALYRLQLAVLESDRYRELREDRSLRERQVMASLDCIDRRVYRALGSWGEARDDAPTALVAVWHDVLDDSAADLLAHWYESEHSRLLLGIEGWRTIRRYERIEGDGPQLLTLHEIDDDAALTTPAYRAATSTTLRSRVYERVTAHERRVFSPWPAV